MNRTLSIVGAGRVGRTLAKRLSELGWHIGAVVARSSATSRAAVRAIGAGSVCARLTPRVFEADIVLL
ncbi:MAG TPA: NAD(P)-binding domain-containing protein, partial [Candidatus Acidoferrales bacterium]|nr:NAD(P)-binding domain-containing protein [Candidatus Acidoferrales bacterium]